MEDSGGERAPHALRGECRLSAWSSRRPAWEGRLLGCTSLPLEHSAKLPDPKEGQRSGEGRPLARESFTAVGLITVVLAVIVPVTDKGRVCADACRALELSWAALEFSCQEGRLSIRRAEGGCGHSGAQSQAAPTQDPLATRPRALTTVRGLVGVVPTIVLCVTLPPEGDALVILAHKLEGRWGQEGLVGFWGTQEVLF